MYKPSFGIGGYNTVYFSDRRRCATGRCLGRSLLLWVNRVGSLERLARLLHPNQRTLAESGGTSHLCHSQTYALEQSAPYSINWSAVASSVWGTVKPRALAVLRLMTSSNSVGCSIGRSAGFEPLRMRST
jgi:hypothetical protein